MSRSQTQREILLAHLAGPRPVDHRQLNSLRGLARHRLLELRPRQSTRPQLSILTPAGRREALAFALAGLEAAE